MAKYCIATIKIAFKKPATLSTKINKFFWKGDNLDSEDPPASYIVKLTTGNSTNFENFEVEINLKSIDLCV